MNYKHINCDYCSGDIGMFDKRVFTCQHCGKEFDIRRDDYDRLMVNDKTGWVFPVRYNQEHVV